MSDLCLAGVTVLRGTRRVLDRIDARLPAGRLTVVIGPNGAGKSTLLQVAAGLLAINEGVVLLGDAPLASIGRKELARRRAYLPQAPTVDWPISVERVIALGLTPSLPTFGNLPSQLQPSIEKALANYDLLALRERPATKISGGELARVLLARATVGDPEILIVDEPTAGLDPKHAMAAIRSLRRDADRGRTVVMAIHDLNLALHVADEIVAIREGRIVAAGVPETVFTEELLEQLYDVRFRITRDADGDDIRFLDPRPPPGGLKRPTE
jgi:iron complex transport system ATP-binding protein